MISWFGIFRLGLVQASLGAVVVLTTSTMNRVMVIELALPAVLPGVLVGLHYLIQIMRPRMGYGSDVGGRRVPWIVGGMAVLVAGGVLAAAATALMAEALAAGIALALLAFLMIGCGVGAAGTSLLALLAGRVEPRRRAAAATIVWLMMIGGIALTGTLAGRALDPFSGARLIEVTASVGAIAMILTLLAVWRAEPVARQAPARAAAGAAPGFMAALREVWAEPSARRFALFVFASMLAYSSQQLVLEPFGGFVFQLPPGKTAGLAGLLHGGVLAGMLITALGGYLTGRRQGALRGWTVGGCLGSGAALLLVAASGIAGPDWSLRPAVFVLGVANGTFAASAIGAMMGLAHDGRGGREGVRIGIWGAAQAVAFALGGLFGTAASDVARYFLADPAQAYACVFVAEAGLFLAAALLAAKVFAATYGGTERDTGGLMAAHAQGVKQ
jgi:BCD family chlorophyll transporter-like MFS transporter